MGPALRVHSFRPAGLSEKHAENSVSLKFLPFLGILLVVMKSPLLLFASGFRAQKARSVLLDRRLEKWAERDRVRSILPSEIRVKQGAVLGKLSRTSDAITSVFCLSLPVWIVIFATSSFSRRYE